MNHEKGVNSSVKDFFSTEMNSVGFINKRILIAYNFKKCFVWYDGKASTFKGELINSEKMISNFLNYRWRSIIL